MFKPSANFKKGYFWVLMHRKSSLSIMGGQNHVKVIMCKFSKTLFLSSYAQKKHFFHHGSSKSGQGHQRPSSANFQKVYFWDPMYRKSIWDIETQFWVKFTNGHQVQRYMLSFKRDIEIWLAISPMAHISPLIFLQA